MLKIVLLSSVLSITACSLVAEHKYISTEKYQVEAYQLCMESNAYRHQTTEEKRASCRQQAATVIDTAEKNFREYRADEHNYRLCRSRYPDIRESDKCFVEQQEKYYKRELNTYKSKL